MRVLSKLFLVVVLLAITANLTYSHCQIPCGNYGDYTRIDLMREHIATIEKSMKQINELSKKSSENMNQVVRWVNNKEEHADKLTEIITYYFLTQRVKIVDPGKSEDFKIYQEKLTLLHNMMVFAMKSKQTTDVSNTDSLSKLVGKFVDVYFTQEQKDHLKEHSKNH